MRIITVLSIGLCIFGCSGGIDEPNQPLPLPKEIIDLGALITEDTPEKFWGKGFLTEMGYTESNDFDVITWNFGRSITVEMLATLPIYADDVVLIYTGYSAPTSEDGWPEAVALTYDAAQYLAAIPVRAFGTDAYNVESMTDQSPVISDNEIAKIIPGHYAFLSQGIPVFEQLVNVDSLLGKANMYFVGAPLNIKNGDGMMVRPIVLVY